MKLASAMTLVGVACISAVGCMSSRGSDVEAPPVVTVAPDSFVLRDVRRDATRFLNCQGPMIDVRMGPWAGSEGNVVAYGCGFQVNYYLRCQTSHLCSFSATD